jgi:hypothetical protein
MLFRGQDTRLGALVFHPQQGELAVDRVQTRKTQKVKLPSSNAH